MDGGNTEIGFAPGCHKVTRARKWNTRMRQLSGVRLVPFSGMLENARRRGPSPFRHRNRLWRDKPGQSPGQCAPLPCPAV